MTSLSKTKGFLICNSPEYGQLVFGGSEAASPVFYIGPDQLASSLIAALIKLDLSFFTSFSIAFLSVSIRKPPLFNRWLDIERINN
jgi:hypothetical protein